MADWVPESGGPTRRPRRSSNRRSHPFLRPEGGNPERGQQVQDIRDQYGTSADPREDGPSTSGFWHFMRGVFGGEDENPVVMHRPGRDFQPPPGEDSSDEDDEEDPRQFASWGDMLLYGDQYEAEGDSDDQEEADNNITDDDTSDMDGISDDEEEDDNEIDMVGYGEEDNYPNLRGDEEASLAIDSDDPIPSGDGGEEDVDSEDLPADRDRLTSLLRYLESGILGTSSRRLIERTAREVYMDQFQPGGRGAEVESGISDRLNRLVRGGISDLQFRGPFLEEEDDPNAETGEWRRLVPITVTLTPSWELVIRDHGRRRRTLNPETIFYEDVEGLRRLRVPSVLADRLTREAFIEKMNVLFMFRDLSESDNYNEEQIWTTMPSLHGFAQGCWFEADIAYPPGGMYTTPTSEVRGIWRRTIRQGIVLQHRLCLGNFIRAVTINDLHHRSAINFLLDACIRSCINCHMMGRLIHNAYNQLEGQEAPIGSLAWMVGRTAIRPLPTPCTQYFPLKEFFGAPRGSRNSIYRSSFGALLYWSELRLAIGDPGNINIRYAGYHIQTAEVYLLSRGTSKNPGYTREELDGMETILSLGTLMLEVAVQWMYVATARILSEHPNIKAYRSVRSTVFASGVPLGSVKLADAEYDLLRRPEVSVARDTTALGQALFLAYYTTRTALTALIRDYAVASMLGHERTAMSAYLGIVLLIQRLGGHLNLILLTLAGAAIHGGRRVPIHQATLPRYTMIADILAPLLQQQTLTGFWKTRDILCHQLGLVPMPGPPTQGKQVVINLAMPSEDLEGLTPQGAIQSNTALGDIQVDLADTLQHYHRMILGEMSSDQLGRQGLERMRGGASRRRGRRGINHV